LRGNPAQNLPRMQLLRIANKRNSFSAVVKSLAVGLRIGRSHVRVKSAELCRATGRRVGVPMRARSAIGCNPTWPRRSLCHYFHGILISVIRLRAETIHPSQACGSPGESVLKIGNQLSLPAMHWGRHSVLVSFVSPAERRRVQRFPLRPRGKLFEYRATLLGDETGWTRKCFPDSRTLADVYELVGMRGISRSAGCLKLLRLNIRPRRPKALSPPRLTQCMRRAHKVNLAESETVQDCVTGEIQLAAG